METLFGVSTLNQRLDTSRTPSFYGIRLINALDLVNNSTANDQERVIELQSTQTITDKTKLYFDTDNYLKLKHYSGVGQATNKSIFTTNGSILNIGADIATLNLSGSGNTINANGILNNASYASNLATVNSTDVSSDNLYFGKTEKDYKISGTSTDTITSANALFEMSKITLSDYYNNGTRAKTLLNMAFKAYDATPEFNILSNLTGGDITYGTETISTNNILFGGYFNGTTYYKGLTLKFDTDRVYSYIDNVDETDPHSIINREYFDSRVSPVEGVLYDNIPLFDNFNATSPFTETSLLSTITGDYAKILYNTSTRTLYASISSSNQFHYFRYLSGTVVQGTITSADSKFILDFVISNNTLCYVVADRSYIRRIDISDPNNPVELGYFNQATVSTPLYICGESDALFVANATTIKRFNINTSGTISTSSVAAWTHTDINFIHAYSRYLYVGFNSGYIGVRISDGSSIVFTSSNSFGGATLSGVIISGSAYTYNGKIYFAFSCGDTTTRQIFVIYHDNTVAALTLKTQITKLGATPRYGKILTTDYVSTKFLITGFSDYYMHIFNMSFIDALADETDYEINAGNLTDALNYSVNNTSNYIVNSLLAYGTLVTSDDDGNIKVYDIGGDVSTRKLYLNNPSNVALDITGSALMDTINEKTTDAGVTIEGVLVKDGFIPIGNISAAKTSNLVSTSALEVVNAVLPCGPISGFAITDATGGNINVAEGIAYMKDSNSDSANIVRTRCEAVSNLVLTDLSVNHIIATYNAAGGIISAITDMSTINGRNIICIGRIYRSGTNIYIQDHENYYNVNVAYKLYKKWEDQKPYDRISGMNISASSTGTRTLAVSSGIYWHSLREDEAFDGIAEAAFDTGGTSVFSYFARTGSAGTFTWYETTVSANVAGNGGTQASTPYTFSTTQINNTVFVYLNTSTNSLSLNNLGGGKYAVHWVYMYHGASTYGHKIGIVLGETSQANNGNSQVGATDALPPSALPPVIQTGGLLLGKIVIVQNAAVFYSIQSAFISNFALSGATAHSDLTGLTTGDDHTQYTLLAGRGTGQTLYGGLNTTNNLSFRANAADLTSGTVAFLDTKEATNATTAGVTIASGLAVAKKLYIGTDLNVGGTLSLTGNVISSLTPTNGTLSLGGVSNYWLNGYITTLNSTTLNIANSGSIVPGTTVALGGASNYFNTGYITTGYIPTIYGATTASGNLNLSSTSHGTKGSIITDSFILPNGNSTLDLGSSSYYFNNGYISNLYTSSSYLNNTGLYPNDTYVPVAETGIDLGDVNHTWRNIYGGNTYSDSIYTKSIESDSVGLNALKLYGGVYFTTGEAYISLTALRSDINTGYVIIKTTTDSNYGTKAGALQVDGGGYFTKKLYVADTTDSSNSTTGSIATAGGLAVGKCLSIAKNATIPIPQDATYFASFATAIAPDMNVGSPTITPTGSPTITGGWLVLSGGAKNIIIRVAGNASFTQTGTIKFKFRCNTQPGATTRIFGITIDVGNPNSNIIMSIDSSYNIILSLYDYANTPLINAVSVASGISLGVEYVIELDINLNSANSTRLFIDGNLKNTYTVAIGSRREPLPTFLKFGDLSQTVTFDIKDVVIYNNIQHTAAFNGSHTYTYTGPTAYATTSDALIIPGNIRANGRFLGNAPGMLLQTISMSHTDPGHIVISQSNVASAILIAAFPYTPVSANSAIIVKFNCKYDCYGDGADSWNGYIDRTDVSGTIITTIADRYQKTNNASGGGGRAGTIFPIEAKYINTATSALYFSIRCAANTGDNFYVITDNYLFEILEYSN